MIRHRIFARFLPVDQIGGGAFAGRYSLVTGKYGPYLILDNHEYKALVVKKHGEEMTLIKTRHHE